MLVPPHIACARSANNTPLCHADKPLEGGPKRAAIGKGSLPVAWPQWARGVSHLLVSLSSSSSRGSRHSRRTTADPSVDPSGAAKRLSLLQAVAQGYCPIAQEEAEQEVLQGNQRAEAKADC